MIHDEKQKKKSSQIKRNRNPPSAAPNCFVMPEQAIEQQRQCRSMLGHSMMRVLLLFFVFFLFLIFFWFFFVLFSSGREAYRSYQSINISVHATDKFNNNNNNNNNSNNNSNNRKEQEEHGGGTSPWALLHFLSLSLSLSLSHPLWLLSGSVRFGLVVFFVYFLFLWYLEIVSDGTKMSRRRPCASISALPPRFFFPSSPPFFFWCFFSFFFLRA